MPESAAADRPSSICFREPIKYADMRNSPPGKAQNATPKRGPDQGALIGVTPWHT